MVSCESVNPAARNVSSTGFGAPSVVRRRSGGGRRATLHAYVESRAIRSGRRLALSSRDDLRLCGRRRTLRDRRLARRCSERESKCRDGCQCP